jgi:hypothetical protein
MFSCVYSSMLLPWENKMISYEDKKSNNLTNINKMNNYSSQCVKANVFHRFFLYLYVYCHLRSNYQEGWVGILLTSLTQHYCIVCHNPGHEFTSIKFNDFKWEVLIVVCFVDIMLNWKTLFKPSFHYILNQSTNWQNSTPQYY